ncbi:MAG: hypothetical protein K6E29_07425, partial [Cyanobacteria bacterium RUI128]|nr:hypothetical protein [Cyanobacteria bacterium RUI128]
KLEAQKLQMANESRRVYETYLNALETTTIEKSMLNPDASVGYKPLTALDLYTYSPSGKQYTLKTMDGRIFIPQSLHDAFQDTDSLAGFLGGYELGPEGTTTIHHDEVLPEGYEHSLSKAFEDAGSSCYKSAVNSNSVGCYAHVLAHIIDYTPETGFGTDGCNEDFYSSSANSYTTTTGASFSIAANDITGAGMDDHGGAHDQTMTEVSAFLNQNETTTVLRYDKTYEETDFSTDAKKLATMYVEGGNGATKTLKQWAQDLYYLCKNYSSLGATAAEVAPTIKEFQKHLSADLDADYVPPYDETVDTIIANDPNKAQWYSNIWNSMNNTDTSNVSRNPDAYTTKTGEIEVGYQVISKPKNEMTYSTNATFNTIQSENYIVIPDDMLNSPEWLTNIVNSGYAILQSYDRKEEILADTSVSVDPDLREVPDEKALRKAEAQYEADMRKIDAKDRKYDVELAAIETERNAIKNEMETLKTVAKDNVERTFKLFG